jgi:hypothetical protein
MTHSEFNHLLSSIKALSPEQMRHLRQELDSELAAAAKRPAGQDLGSLGAMRDAAERDEIVDPLLGSMSDHAELMDQIVEDAMRHRELHPWRLTAGE